MLLKWISIEGSRSTFQLNKDEKKSLTFRCFPLKPVADVGVIVTDGVIERLLPVLEWFIPLRFGEPPAVNTAPPGSDDLVGNIGIGPCVDRLIEIDGVRFFKWAGGAIAGKVVGVNVSEPLVITDVGSGAADCVTMMFSLSSCCDCLIFLSRTNFVSSLRSSSLSLRRFLSRSQISAADNSCKETQFWKTFFGTLRQFDYHLHRNERRHLFVVAFWIYVSIVCWTIPFRWHESCVWCFGVRFLFGSRAKHSIIGPLFVEYLGFWCCNKDDSIE